jgi:tRNA(Ile)-lysidine synthase
MKPIDLENSFAEFIQRHSLVAPSDEVIVAVSSGVDSMVLLRLFHAVRGRLGCGLGVAHVNHGLRGPESEADELFVRAASEELGLPFHLHRCDPPTPAGTHSSVQDRARSERYAFFTRLRQGRMDVRIATGHHADDNAETVLFNFLRGAGVRGLSGIPLTHDGGGIIRPLLFADRGLIAAYAASRTVPFREDSSNRQSKYTRNLLRNEIIPLIADRVNPGLRGTLNRTASLFTDLGSYLRGQIDGVLREVVESDTGDELRISIPLLERHPLFLRESVLHDISRSFTQQGGSFAHIAALIDLVSAKSGSSCTLGENFHVYRDREQLIILKTDPGKPFLFPVRAGEAYDFGNFTFSSSFSGPGTAPGHGPEEVVDADLLGDDLHLRSWNDGDWFVPLGMESRKKLSDFFVDRKISVPDKKRIPILVSGDSVVWVCGERIDNRFRLTADTKRPLKLTYSRLAG